MYDSQLNISINKPLVGTTTPLAEPDSINLFVADDIYSFDGLHNRILATLNSMGFFDYCLTYIDELTHQVLLSTYPARLQENYTAHKYSEQDLLLRYAAENTRAIFMSDLYRYAFDAPYDMPWIRVNWQICNLYQQHGFYEFYCLPLASGESKNKLVLTVAAQGRDPVDFREVIGSYKILLHSLGESINTVVRALLPEMFLSATAAIPVNSKPLLVLNTLANNDITLTQVADKLHISTITASQHIATARKALGARTTLGAIKKALTLGLIRYN